MAVEITSLTGYAASTFLANNSGATALECVAGTGNGQRCSGDFADACNSGARYAFKRHVDKLHRLANINGRERSRFRRSDAVSDVFECESCGSIDG